MRNSIVEPQPHRSQDANTYMSDDVPPAGMKVEVITYVGDTRHVIPFICCWSDDGWVYAGTRRKLAFDVAGWRKAGFDGASAQDHARK